MIATHDSDSGGNEYSGHAKSAEKIGKFGCAFICVYAGCNLNNCCRGGNDRAEDKRVSKIGEASRQKPLTGVWTMRQLTKKFVEFMKKEDGPTAVEYAVMLALIVVVCIAAITTVGTNANNTFSSIAVKGGPPAAS
jgi:pilus assembly protein Flp/PilA